MYCVQYFREKIKAEVEGRPYTAPPPSKTTSGAAAGPGGANMTRNSRSFGKNNWDDWGDGPSGAGRPAKVCNQPCSHSTCRPCDKVRNSPLAEGQHAESTGRACEVRKVLACCADGGPISGRFIWMSYIDSAAGGCTLCALCWSVQATISGDLGS